MSDSGTSSRHVDRSSFAAVGISLMHSDGSVETKAATGELVWELDRLQYELNDGPCVSSLREEPVIVVHNIAHEQRWQRFVPEAVRLGLSTPNTKLRDVAAHVVEDAARQGDGGAS